MSKQALTSGFFDYGEIGYGLLSASVDRQPSKIDCGDTNTNNDILIGRKSWTFTVQVISNNLKPLVVDGSEKTIAIGIGNDFYVGTGIILSVTHSGQLDNKIMYNINGEFLPNAYYGIDDTNGLYFLDTDGNGTPDGWTMAAPSYSFDAGGAYINLNLGSSTNFYRSKAFDNGISYIRFCRYVSDNLSTLQMDSSGHTANLSGDTSFIVTTYFDIFTTTATDDQSSLYIVTGGTPALRVYHMVFAKLIDSLT